MWVQRQELKNIDRMLIYDTQFPQIFSSDYILLLLNYYVDISSKDTASK